MIERVMLWIFWTIILAMVVVLAPVVVVYHIAFDDDTPNWKTR